MARLWTIYSLALLVLSGALAQPCRAQHSIQSSIALSPYPSPRISDWQSKRETITLTLTNTTAHSVSANIQATLSLNGIAVASTKLDAMPTLVIPPGQHFYDGSDVFPQQAISFSGDAGQRISNSGTLPEGSYRLCVTIVASETHDVISTPSCGTFAVSNYSLPALLQPNDRYQIIAGLEPAILFSWTPIVPVPPSIVAYRIRLVELLPSQDPKQAILNNRPEFDRVVTGTTQVSWPADYRFPTAGGTFAWSVEPEHTDGTPIVTPQRFAEPYLITVLPSQEECLKLLHEVTFGKDSLQAEESRYWNDYALFVRIRSSLENAKERADIYDIKRLERDLDSAETIVRAEESLHRTARARYDTALKRYQQCTGR